MAVRYSTEGKPVTVSPTTPEVKAEVMQKLAKTIDEAKRPDSRFASETKRRVTIWLDKDVIAAMKAEGPGWQTRINEMLRGKYGA